MQSCLSDRGKWYKSGGEGTVYIAVGGVGSHSPGMQFILLGFKD